MHIRRRGDMVAPCSLVGGPGLLAKGGPATHTHRHTDTQTAAANEDMPQWRGRSKTMSSAWGSRATGRGRDERSAAPCFSCKPYRLRFTQWDPSLVLWVKMALALRGPCSFSCDSTAWPSPRGRGGGVATKHMKHRMGCAYEPPSTSPSPTLPSVPLPNPILCTLGYPVLL